MREKIHLDTPHWTDTPRVQNFGELHRTIPRGAGRLASPGLVEPVPKESMIELRDRLRNEINRGKEYLAQVRRELHDSREVLEEWAQYELTCSLHPLEHLVQSTLLKESVEQFLIGWLNRREMRLQQLTAKLESNRPGRAASGKK
jgi:hypothetical protein